MPVGFICLRVALPHLPLGTEKSGKFFPPYQADLPLFSVPNGKSATLRRTPMKRKIVLTVAMLIVITAGIEPEIKAWLGKLGFSVQ